MADNNNETNEKEERRANRPGHERIDEISIKIVPRYKTSFMSGDQWRTSVLMEIKSKGIVLAKSDDYATIQAAILGCGHLYLEVMNNVNLDLSRTEEFCDQEGCKEKPTVTFRMKKQLSMYNELEDPYINKFDIGQSDKRPLVRKFCSRHSIRGDCGLEDTDENYETIEGTVAKYVKKKDKSVPVVSLLYTSEKE